MREFTKIVLSLVLMIAFIAALLSWFGSDRPDTRVWQFRIGAPVTAIVALALILHLHLQRDLVPDFLHQKSGTYFNRGGFSFVIGIVDIDGVGHVLTFFQNQRDSPCIGRIALRPARRFLRGRPSIDPISIQIDCAPAAFGVAYTPIAISKEFEGRIVRFELGCRLTTFREKVAGCGFRTELLFEPIPVSTT